jgi:hypothetical protein
MFHRFDGVTLKHDGSDRMLGAVQVSDERVPLVVTWGDFDDRLSGQGDSYIGLVSAQSQEQGQIDAPSSYLLQTHSRLDGSRRIVEV